MKDLMVFHSNNINHLLGNWPELGGYRRILNPHHYRVVEIEGHPFSLDELSRIEATGGLSYLKLGKPCLRNHNHLAGKSLRYSLGGTCVECLRLLQAADKLRPPIPMKLAKVA